MLIRGNIGAINTHTVAINAQESYDYSMTK